MLFLGGAGFAGLTSAKEASRLPRDIRAHVAGVSGGALGALAVALSNYDAILQAVDAASWPGDPRRLKEVLDKECTLGLTFSTWQMRGSVPFCVIAFDCVARRPVLFSESTTPDVSVAAAVAAASAWPGASSDCAVLQMGRTYCDVEFFLSPLDIFAHLKPARAVAFLGTQPVLHSIPGRIADYHIAFMSALRRPCVGFVASISSPHIVDSILRRDSAAALLRTFSQKHNHRHTLPVGHLLCFAVIFAVVLTAPARKIYVPARSRAAMRRARKRQHRRWIGIVS